MPTRETNNPVQTKDDLFYAAVVSGWLTTKLERDKGILTLAAGGIGLVVTLMTTVGPASCSMLWLYGLSVACFLASLITVVVVFDRNGDHLAAVANGKNEEEPKLILLDAISFWAFIAGACFLALLGLITGINKLDKQMEDVMATNSQNSTTSQIENKSVNGVAALRPQTPSGSQQGQQPTQTPAENGSQQPKGQQ